MFAFFEKAILLHFPGACIIDLSSCQSRSHELTEPRAIVRKAAGYPWVPQMPWINIRRRRLLSREPHLEASARGIGDVGTSHIAAALEPLGAIVTADKANARSCAGWHKTTHARHHHLSFSNEFE